MNENIKQILLEIDGIIEEITKKGNDPSVEVVDLLEDIANDLNDKKENKKLKLSKDLVDKLDKLIGITSNSGEISTKTSKDIVEAIKGIKIETKAPQVNVSPPKVSVTVPDIKVPDVNVPETKVYNPDTISVNKPSWLGGLFSLKPVITSLKEIKSILRALYLPRDADDPVSVRLSDGNKFYRAMGGIASAITGHIPFSKESGVDFPALVDKDRHQQVDVLTSGLPSGAATAVKQQPPVTTPTEYNKTLTSADTEYSQVLPANTREFRFRCRTLFDVRYSFTTSKVATPTAPYFTLPAGSDYISDNNNLTSKTLYLASAEAGVVVELEVYI